MLPPWRPTPRSSTRLLGTAAPNFGNKPMAELAQANIEAVGMPKWTADDQAFAKLVQETQAAQDRAAAHQSHACCGAPTSRSGADRRRLRRYRRHQWTVPTITIRYPVQHSQYDRPQCDLGDGEATPIAHKGAVAGAKAVAMTVLDLMTTPEQLAKAKNISTPTSRNTITTSRCSPPPTCLRSISTTSPCSKCGRRCSRSTTTPLNTRHISTNWESRIPIMRRPRK